MVGLKKLVFTILFGLAFSFFAIAQDDSASDSIVYTTGIQRIFSTPNPASFGADYEPFIKKWQSNSFSAEQKNQIGQSLLNMEKKGFRPRFDFKAILNILSLAEEKEGFNQEQLNALIKACLKVSEGYDKEMIDQFYQYATIFLADKALYKDPSYGIYIENGSSELKFNGYDDVEDQAPVPQQQGPDAIQLLLMKQQGVVPEETEPLVNPADEPLSLLPLVMGPVIEFKNIDLVFLNRLDTIYLRGTSGTFSFETLEFKGQGGAVDWTNVGLSAESTYAKLRNYFFNVTQTDFRFEESYFYYSGKLNDSVSGIVEITLTPQRANVDSYPKFISDYADAPINDLGTTDLNYKGGISYEGREFFSRSAFNDLSILEGIIDGKRKFRAVGSKFFFNKEDSLVTSPQAEVTIYHGQDSIYHPAVEFSYQYDSYLLNLEPQKKDFRTTPFNSSYYKVDLTGDRLTWNVKTDSLNISIRSARAEVPLVVESKNFFSASRFSGLSQLYNFHPLILAVRQAQKDEPKNEFYLSELADERKLNIGILKRTMIDLMSKGMVLYNSYTDQVIITEKGLHYYDSGRDESDFDDLVIPSIISTAPNVTVDLLNDTLTVRGVEQFFLSDSLDVLITPKDGIIKIFENRNIEFDGVLEAGNFQFNGRKFKFRYDTFLIQLTQIDSIKLEVEVSEGRREALNNQLVNTSGTLLINDPNNKSARVSKPDYPIFSTNQSANVFFDKSKVLGGAYDSTVYFDVPPFKLDSASKADPSAYQFKGNFYSNNIFPVFKESLRAMPDKSFGFVHTIPDSGYNLYGSSGRAYGEINMDQSGLSSPGVLAFLTGRFNAEKVVFFPDSMYSKTGIKGDIVAGTLNGTSYPSVQLSRYEINWLAKKDSMKLRNLADPFKIYDSLGRFNGTLTLSTQALYGTGEMQMQGSINKSENFILEESQYVSRNASFELSSPNPRKPILSSEDVRVDYDLAKNKANIQPEVQGNAALSFPFAQYNTSIANAEWDIANKVITMVKPDTVPIEKSFFYSTRKSMDSLAFSGTNAKYDIEKQELKVGGIPYIIVADALISPENDEVLILENSELGILKNAVVVFDTANTNHKLFDAEIEILSRNRFRGVGTYELVTVQDTFAIKFDEFRFVEDEEHGLFTKSSGDVKAEDGVIISPGFTFKGKVFMYAFRKALEIKGAVKLNLQKLKEKNVWIEYESNDDISEVVFSFDNARTEFGEPLNAGLHFNSGDIYLSFITEKRGFDDDDFFIPTGGDLFYDQGLGTYNIANPKKSAEPSNFYKGSMFSYNEDTEDVTFEGKLNFVSPLSKGFAIEASGKGTGNLDSADFKVNAMMAMDFGLPITSAPLMAQNLRQMGDKLGVRRAHDDRSDLIYKVAEFIGDEATKKWDASYQSVPIPLVNASSAGELMKNLVISNVDLKWSKQLRSFYSEGKISVSNINNLDINMELDGFVEIKKTPEGDIVNVLIQMTEGTWYYFTYDGFRLGAFSSNEVFNASLLGGDGKKNKIGNSKIGLYSLEEVIAWAQNYKKLFYGIDEPFVLAMAGDGNQKLKKKEVVEGDGF
ncbi:MAG: hypothetical protein ACJAS3_001301 [Roseivirga sp.]|jgi:hypothetical protein